MKSFVHEKYDKLDQEVMPVEEKHVGMIERQKDMFFSVTVPDQIERQSGEVSRKLKKEYETFDIEKQKENKRWL